MMLTIYRLVLLFFIVCIAVDTNATKKMLATLLLAIQQAGKQK